MPGRLCDPEVGSLAGGKNFGDLAPEEGNHGGHDS